MEPQPFLDAITQTCMPSNVQVSNAMVAAFLLVCNEHGLNPFTREIFAFPTRTGGIQPIVSVDGWIKLVTQHPQYNGMEFDMQLDEKSGKPLSCTCTIYRKDREKHMPITEYFDECYRETEPWKKMPKRMMRHKALKEAARYTFGFAGIQDEDEGRDAVINITAEATVMQKETLSKAETLKEKIGAKKAKETVTTTVPAQEPPIEVTSIPTPTSQPDPLLQAMAEDFGPDEPPKRDPESTLSDEERKAIIDILKAKAPTDALNAKVQQEARKFFASIGAKSTKDLKFKDYQGCLDWANGLTV
jgi:phage recombination protein Bet